MFSIVRMGLPRSRGDGKEVTVNGLPLMFFSLTWIWRLCFPLVVGVYLIVYVCSTLH